MTRAERWLGSLDPIGWRFGLDRIEALLAELGDPQHSFESVHVVGTNGKSSVARMAAALLSASGRSAGCYLSPHRHEWRERVEIEGRVVEPDAFAAACDRVASATARVERRLPDGERVTQFEAATAAAFCALADAGVEVGVIEAGLGGRLDATNVLRSRVTALTSVGLDHTEFLGETRLEIASEKLAVLRTGTTLVCGRLTPEVAELAARTAAERDCALIATEGVESASGRAPYLERNMAVALAAAEVIAGSIPDTAVAGALARLELPGRFELLAGDPPLVIDAAHNPEGADALAEAVALTAAGRPVVACIAVLADKDAAGIARALAPALSEVVATEFSADRMRGVGRPGASPLGAVELAAVFASQGVRTRAVARPDEAVRLAIALARERGGVALVAGSHYLVDYAWTERPAQNSSR